MILKALNYFYDRIPDLPPAGYSPQKVGFSLVITPEGKLLQIDAETWEEEVVQKNGKVKTFTRNKILQLPYEGDRTSGIRANFLFDSGKYLLGYDGQPTPAPRIVECFEACRARHLAAEKEIDSPEFSAICRFLESWDPAQASSLPGIEHVGTSFGVFKIALQKKFVHELPKVRTWWAKQVASKSDEKAIIGTCLITGEEGPLAELHAPKIKNVPGAQSAGALLVSFNASAYESYGKASSYNAPVSQDAAFRYCTALNWLLDRQNKRSVLIGDTTVVFWTETPTPAENLFASMFDSGAAPVAEQEGEDKGLASGLETILKAIAKGAYPPELGDADTPFYVLGLAPNASRLSVRFWHQSTLGKLVHNLHDHFRDLEIVGRRDWEPEFPSPRDLLPETVRDAKDIPPLLGGALMRAILLGSPYPEMLLVAILRRIRVEQNINYLKAAIVKACLNRNHQKEVSMSLDLANPDAAYHMGRLFAVFDKCHTDAIQGVNASIKDRYFGAASATPGSVFPRLIRMNQHHIGKMEIGQATYYEKLLQSICDKIQKFPSHLSLEQQGLFALGYYHQRQDLYTKKTKPEPEAVSV